MDSTGWARLPGTQLPGGFEVEEMVAAGENSATFKIRILGDRFTQASGEFFRSGFIPEQQVAVWSAAIGLAHRNVSPPLAAGIHENLPYYIEVQPDETLDTVLHERKLTAEEAREVARSLAQGLALLHANGFAQAWLSPVSVAAIGEQICLRLRGARHLNAPLTPGEDASAAGDVFRFGKTLFTVLTGKEANGENVSDLPAPFDKIIGRCLDPNPEMRCSVWDVITMLDQRPVAMPAPAALPEPTAEKPPVAAPRVEAIAALEPAPRSPLPRRTPRRLYLAMGAVVAVAILVWLALPKHQETVAKPAASAWPTHEAAPAPANAAPANTATAAPPPPPAVVPHPAAASKNGDIWRVIAFTFSREQDAQKRAAAINGKHAALHAEVFTPSGGSPYLVALGGGSMNREQAEQLRRRARSEGLPRDTYIQNYRH